MRKLWIFLLFLLLPMVMLYTLWSDPTSAGEDDVVYYWPLRVMVAQQLKAGHWPVWDANEAAGVPLFADPQSAVFFPPNWIFLALEPKLAYSLCLFMAFSVAGGGTHLYLRRIGLGPVAAIFGGLAYMFCGFMVGHRVHLAMIQAAGLLPWGLWVIERMRVPPSSVAKRSLGVLAGAGVFGSRGLLPAKHPQANPDEIGTWGWHRAAWLTAIFALMLASGHWPTAIIMTGIWLVYLLCRARPLGKALLTAGVAVVAGCAIMSPQIIATGTYLAHSARSVVPLSVAGENSFFPLCGVLAFFPFIMGSRTPNEMAGDWWGPWHLCEMLGYVGLVTLMLAAAAIWRLWRRRGAANMSQAGSTENSTDTGVLSSLARLWTVLLVVGGIWMLGYYIPPLFRIIHALPGMGSVRCPARLLMLVDLALAVLAAMGLDALVGKRQPLAGNRLQATDNREQATGIGKNLSASLLRWSLVYMPLCLLACLGALAGLAKVEGRWWTIAPLLTNVDDAAATFRSAMRLTSPAVYVPLALAVLTAGAVVWFLRAPDRRGWLIVVLLLADLFTITRFVDVAAGGQVNEDPQNSPAAAWLAANAPNQPYRVWGLSYSYHYRPAELLLPKTAAALGVQTIGYYGPLMPNEYGLLFGFRPWGWNENWEWLIRRNHLLSLYNVRYVLAADTELRHVIESVKIPESPAPPDGPKLMVGNWMGAGLTSQINHARQIASGPAGRLDEYHLRAPGAWEPAYMCQWVNLPEPGVYRLGLDACAPEGSGNFISVGLLGSAGGTWWQGGQTLRVDIEQINRQWRHFEKTIEVSGSGSMLFQVLTMSERPMAVRNLFLRKSTRDAPVNAGGKLGAGEPVYVDRTPEGLKPLRPGDPPVHIYENRLCTPGAAPANWHGIADQIEKLRWNPQPECQMSNDPGAPGTK